jgi:tRNA 2-selenouridine synthase
LKFGSLATVAQLGEFDEIIDVRSPSEFAIDHAPRAISLPVLDDAERARVGTLYKQKSSFDAKKIGAALVARNIAKHLETELLTRQKNWRPLVYCWRGGNRSSALAHVLQKIGWDAHTLGGGYKAYRHHVIYDTQRLVHLFSYRVICGPTGSGKSQLLQALARNGEQVLDLEAMAEHRGSVLGNLPDCPQPAQKLFESRIWQSLRGFQPDRPVFVEAESKKIGLLRVPEILIETIRQGRCVVLDIPMASRIDFLKREYVHFLSDFADLEDKLNCLHALYGAKKISDWLTYAKRQDWDILVAELLMEHYDPAYRRSTQLHFSSLDNAPILRADQVNEDSIAQLARELVNLEIAVGAATQ